MQKSSARMEEEAPVSRSTCASIKGYSAYTIKAGLFTKPIKRLATGADGLAIEVI
jgi:hypothetical protein